MCKLQSDSSVTLGNTALDSSYWWYNVKMSIQPTPYSPPPLPKVSIALSYPLLICHAHVCFEKSSSSIPLEGEQDKSPPDISPPPNNEIIIESYYIFVYLFYIDGDIERYPKELIQKIL